MIVEGCDDCPLEYDSCWCHHPERPVSLASSHIGEHIGEGTSPDWCPLLFAPLVLSHAKQIEEAKQWPVTVLSSCQACGTNRVDKFSQELEQHVASCEQCGKAGGVMLGFGGQVFAEGRNLLSASTPITP